MDGDPEETPNPSSPALLRDTRWIAAAIWAGLLAALLFTSAQAVDAFTQGSVASNVFGLGELARPEKAQDARAITGIALSGLAALLLLGAWFSYVRMTRAIIVAYTFQGEGPDEAPILAEWLSPHEREEADSNHAPAAWPRSLIGDVLALLGLAWAVIILTPAVLSAVRAWS